MRCKNCAAIWADRCADCWMRTVSGDFVTPPLPESREFELEELINFATIVINAAENQLDPEEADAEFNAVLVDLDADDASFLVDLMLYQLTDPLPGGALKSPWAQIEEGGEAS